ncbi:hypothetical protein F5Y15DRAFT_422709 [Xylariaceae sp. FL0016]|nr:hypothetical protein F5Y15DRAFT_422709 [Xylariaceae sp. FL0016]
MNDPPQSTRTSSEVSERTASEARQPTETHDQSNALQKLLEDHKQAPELPRGPKCYSIWTDSWLWEFLGLSLSIGCLVAIVIVLKAYNQGPVPRFWYGITLNTVVSILATFSKSALIVAVAAAIGQLKWHWYRIEGGRSPGRGRSLYDTELFDEASRGPWGSAVLLTKIHLWSQPTVALGAFVVVASLAFEPSVQQLILIPTRSYPRFDGVTQPTAPWVKVFSDGFSWGESDS